MNASTKMWWGNKIVPSRNYRIFSFITIAAFIGLSALMIIFGEELHNHFGYAGEESGDAYMHSFLMLVGTYLPISVLFVRWMDFKNWKELNTDKTYRWQGLLAASLILLWVIMSVAWLFSIMALCDYRLEDPKSVTPVVKPSLLLTSRLSQYFMIQSIVWSFFYLLSFLNTKPEK